MIHSKCAFAVYAKGERFERYKTNLINKIEKFVPGVDVVELDAAKATPLLSGLSEEDRPYFMRLAIPLMDVLRRYDRVVWVDADIDIVSGDFSRVLEAGTSHDGLAAVPDIDQPNRLAYIRKLCPDFNGDAYVNSGVMVFDLCKIDPDEWRRRILDGLKRWSSGKFRWHDQEVFNFAFSIAPIDGRFNDIWRNGKASKESAWAVHYCDQKGHAILDGILDSRTDSADACLGERPI